MDELNPKIIRHTLDSGLEIEASPLSMLTYQAIRAAAFEKFPDPDGTTYRLPIENAAIEGDTRPPEDNPEYVVLLDKARTDRAWYITNAILEIACGFEERRQELIERFAAQRKRIAKYAELPKDEWEATLRHCIFVNDLEPRLILDAVLGQVPLTQDEVGDGLKRYFRIVIQGQAVARLVG
jgi:hypothetical protein